MPPRRLRVLGAVTMRIAQKLVLTIPRKMVGEAVALRVNPIPLDHKVVNNLQHEDLLQDIVEPLRSRTARLT